jgi:hypothetical protein
MRAAYPIHLVLCNLIILNDIWWKSQIKNLLIVQQFSSASYDLSKVNGTIQLKNLLSLALYIYLLLVYLTTLNNC